MEIRMRVLLNFLALSLAFSHALAQPGAGAKPEDKCSMSGQVIDAITGEPLKKAELTLQKSGMPSTPSGAVTDASGQFVITGIDPGNYFLHVERNGFLPQAYRAEDRKSVG